MSLTYAEENYLKAIQRLEIRGEKVTTNAIAHELETKASSVTDMVQKLARKKLVNYSKYKAISLTANGKKIALLVIRKHRLWETFLVEKLRFKWNEVHFIAEQLEHIDAEMLVDRLDEFLGYPRFDPHGDPIPDKNGKFRAPQSSVTLDSCMSGQRLIVVGVKDSSDGFLKFLNELGVQLGTQLTLLRKFSFDQSVEVEMPDKKIIVLNSQASANLLVNEA